MTDPAPPGKVSATAAPATAGTPAPPGGVADEGDADARAQAGLVERLGRPSSTPPRILILGGTSEARALAGSLPGTVITSLAGRTSSPLLPAGEVRVGGFGGIDGLTAYLRAQGIDVLVDATHPFAATISANAAHAAGRAGVPLVVLQRPGWIEQPGDNWHRVRDLTEAAALLTGHPPHHPTLFTVHSPHHPAPNTESPSRTGVPRTLATAGSSEAATHRRVFLTTGRQGIAAFAEVDAWFLARSVEPPEPPMPRRLEVLLDRGPYTLEGERRLLDEHRIDVLVTKDSGGPDPKLVAAREHGIPVVMVNRPPTAATAHPVTSVAEAVERVRSLLH